MLVGAAANTRARAADARRRWRQRRRWRRRRQRRYSDAESARPPYSPRSSTTKKYSRSLFAPTAAVSERTTKWTRVPRARAISLRHLPLCLLAATAAPAICTKAKGTLSVQTDARSHLHSLTHSLARALCGLIANLRRLFGEPHLRRLAVVESARARCSSYESSAAATIFARVFLQPFATNTRRIFTAFRGLKSSAGDVERATRDFVAPVVAKSCASAAAAARRRSFACCALNNRRIGSRQRSSRCELSGS